ncbi:hypothetical protein B9Z55_027907 [Caenorhabditis nigoni]|uniref:Uncharacterized protein n=1 Tax=Caenorhabditis nigoni TaxID=1611254 RepID=A0A2G5SEI6_9PELO|nr:hypothetical protein B9Z55_027907 [Caenorhabditis nigoni]
MAKLNCSCFSELSKWMRPEQHGEGNNAQHMLQRIFLPIYSNADAFIFSQFICIFKIFLAYFQNTTVLLLNKKDFCQNNVYVCLQLSKFMINGTDKVKNSKAFKVSTQKKVKIL